MKTIKLIGLLFCAAVLHSCFSNCNEIKISNDDRVWSKCYKKANTLVFLSDLNHRDTFVLKKKYEDFTTCSKFELGPNVYNYLGINFSNKNEKDQNTIALYLDKDIEHDPNQECVKSFQVYDLYASFDSIGDKRLIVEYISLPAIHNKPIKTYRFVVGDHFSSDSSDKVESFNWSKRFGVVKYVMQFTGEEYYLNRIK